MQQPRAIGRAPPPLFDICPANTLHQDLRFGLRLTGVIVCDQSPGCHLMSWRTLFFLSAHAIAAFTCETYVFLRKKEGRRQEGRSPCRGESAPKNGHFDREVALSETEKKRGSDDESPEPRPILLGPQIANAFGAAVRRPHPSRGMGRQPGCHRYTRRRSLQRPQHRLSTR